MADGHVQARAMSPPSDGDAAAQIKVEDVNIKPALTPPTSESTKDMHDDSESELSDLDPPESPQPAIIEEKTIDDELGRDEEIIPDHYWDGGKIPVFKPTMREFRSFKVFMAKIDKYGMKSGIVKVIPPQEWRDSLPALDEAVKSIRVKNPITQEFHGTHGTYTQANMEKQRTYNLPQWRALCEESNHQPPAKRGERRRNLEKPSQTRLNRPKAEPAPNAADKQKRGPGRPRVRPLPPVSTTATEAERQSAVQTPPTPSSPIPKASAKGKKSSKEKAEKDHGAGTKGRQPKSVSSRRLNNQRDQVEYIDEEAFKDFDYRIHDQQEWTTERVQELETAYWRSLNFNNPMYGADMPGSLFKDSTESWNVAKLENLLDVLGQAVPGVNTAYLYLGMWKASFAWHLEDVDLYSINYIHFGAPKQWYSISQEDARRFENAMKSVWPTDAKNCDQFLRHKTYLISPQLLQSQYNIKVNRLVHYEGEFVITFPYGYHSGYNLGYNCAESVNFATEAWLDFGKVARKCHCEADNVWVDVREIERKLRGEPTPEYYEETDDDDEEEDEEPEAGLPTPPGSVKGKGKRGPKRKRPVNEKEPKRKIKKLKIRVRAPAFEPCILCPNDDKYQELLSTDSGQRAHRICGLLTPETYVSKEVDGSAMVRDIAIIDKARLELKCNYCRSKKGAVFQCSSKKCTKAYHATCAMPAGIQIDIGLTSVYGEDGTEYVGEGQDFRCRIHRSKRGKNADSWSLESNDFVQAKAKKLSFGEAVQAQFYQGDIFAGNVIENRKSEQNVLLEVLPKGDRIEVDWKWLLFFDPANSQLAIPSENAKPLPADMLRKSRTTVEDPAAKVEGAPLPNDPFCDPNAIQKWSEFESCRPFYNKNQEKVEIFKDDHLWHFLGEISTDAKQHYTHDPNIRQHNPKSSFLDLEKSKQLAESMKRLQQQKTFVPAPGSINQHAINAARANNPNTNTHNKTAASKERPYTGKYAIHDHVPASQRRYTQGFNVDQQAFRMQHPFQQQGSADATQRNRPNHYPYDRYHSAQDYRSSNGSGAFVAPVPYMGSSSTGQHYPQYSPQSEFSYNANVLLRKINMASSIPPLQPPPQHSRPSSSQAAPQLPQPPAPVANMMGTAAPEASGDIKQEPVTFKEIEPSTMPSPPPSNHSRPSEPGSASPLLTPPASLPPAKGISDLDLDPKYIYLHEAEKIRPRTYQSPYATGGGFNEGFLPAPAADRKQRPRAPSISEAYLMTRSPSEQGTLNARIIEDKEKFLQQQVTSRNSPSSLNTQTSQGSFQTMPNHQQRPSHLPMSAFQNPPPYYTHQNQPAYPSNQTATSLSYSQYPSNTYHPPPFHASGHQPPSQYNQHHLHYSKPNGYSSLPPYQPSTLNFQSPQAFREQMLTEAQRSPAHDEGYERFSQTLKDAALNEARAQVPDQQHWYSGSDSRPGTSAGGGYGSIPGHAGSPLRHEFGKGEEMLPVMRDEATLTLSR